MIEAGIRFPLIQRGLGFGVSRLAGCLISHSHMDHCRAVETLAERGVDIYLSKETMATLGLAGHRYHVLDPNQMHATIGPWAVIPFETEHDTEGSLGFLIMNGDEKILFLTDTAYVRHRFNGLTRIMIEANFGEQIIRGNVVNGSVNRAVKQRTYGSHMSIERCLKMLKANDLSRVQEIILLHLSDANSDADEFKRKVQEATGVPVRIA